MVFFIKVIITAIAVFVVCYFIAGFSVDGWLSAIVFSLIVSTASYILNKFVN